MTKKKFTKNISCHRSIFAAVDEDTIVFVFGDHGMTPTGDHGGETALETDAALLLYTPRALFDPAQVWYREKRQGGKEEEWLGGNT